MLALTIMRFPSVVVLSCEEGADENLVMPFLEWSQSDVSQGHLDLAPEGWLSNWGAGMSELSQGSYPPLWDSSFTQNNTSVELTSGWHFFSCQSFRELSQIASISPTQTPLPESRSFFTFICTISPLTVSSPESSAMGDCLFTVFYVCLSQAVPAPERS